MTSETQNPVEAVAQLPGHVWSSPAKGAPPVVCLKCGTPKVIEKDWPLQLALRGFAEWMEHFVAGRVKAQDTSLNFWKAAASDVRRAACELEAFYHLRDQSALTSRAPEGGGSGQWRPNREAIARLIDPSSWRVMDGYLEDMKRKYAGQDCGYDPDAFKHKPSLAVADAILKLPSPPRDPPTADDAPGRNPPDQSARIRELEGALREVGDLLNIDRQAFIMRGPAFVVQMAERARSIAQAALASKGPDHG